MQKEQFIWAEKYRPQTIEDCILPTKLKSTFRQMVKDGKIPHLLFSGKSGIGKTTVAKALCKDLNTSYRFFNASEQNGIDLLRNDIKSYASSMSFGGGPKVIILDEADYLNAQSIQPALRAFIEEFSVNCSFIFTCNHKNKIIPALHSRLSHVEFVIPKDERKSIGVEYLNRISSILTKESIPFNKNVIAEVVLRFYPDLRKTLNELQKFSKQNGEINEGILVQASSLDLDILFDSLKNKKLGRLREWVVNSLDNDTSKIYRLVYDAIWTKLKPASVAQAIWILGQYQAKDAWAVDSEIHLMACFTEILKDCEFKEDAKIT